MARCTNCGGEMGQTEPVCPHCGYDFPPRSERSERKGLVYSPMADFALLIGQVVAGLACVLALVGCARSVLQGEWVDAFIRGPIAVILLLAVFIVFARTLDKR